MTTKLYGDENTGYKVEAEARNLTPERARDVLITNIDDGIYEKMPDERRSALVKRAEEGGLSLIIEE